MLTRRPQFQSRQELLATIVLWWGYWRGSRPATSISTAFRPPLVAASSSRGAEAAAFERTRPTDLATSPCKERPDTGQPTVRLRHVPHSSPTFPDARDTASAVNLLEISHYP